MKFLRSFKGRIISASALLVAISLCVSNFLAYGKLSDNMYTKNNQYMSLLVKEASLNVKSWVSTIVGGLEKTAPGFANVTSEHDILLMLKQIDLTTPANSILVAYSDGTTFDSENGMRDPKIYDPRSRSWYQEAKKKGKGIVTDIYIDAATGKKLVSMADPFIWMVYLKAFF